MERCNKNSPVQVNLLKLKFLLAEHLQHGSRNLFPGNTKLLTFDLFNMESHGLRTPNEGINQRNLKIWVDVAKAMKSSPLLGPFWGSGFWKFSLLKI